MNSEEGPLKHLNIPALRGSIEAFGEFREV
jgi:hypothetical protein